MSGGLPAGITRRHGRSCPAAEAGGRCRCPYVAQAGPRRARLTKSHETLSEAVAWKRKVDEAFASGTVQLRAAPRLRDFAEAWLTAAEHGSVTGRGGRRYRPSTLRGYRRAFEQRLYPELGGTPMDQITRGRVNMLIQQIAAEGVAASTIRNMVIPLRAVYRHAIALEHVSRNPTRGALVPTGSGRRERVAAADEATALLAALEPGDDALWATAVYTGARRGELMALMWSDVDLGRGVVHIRRAYDPGAQATDLPKTLAGTRVVPIIAVLRDFLLEHRHRTKGRGLVFCRRALAGTHRRAAAELPFSDTAVAARAGRAWAAAALQPIGMHECRHTFASLMIAAMAAGGTFNPKALQAMMGHSSITVTYDRYGHLFPGAEQQAASMLDAYLEQAESAAVEVPEVTEALSRLRGVLAGLDGERLLPVVAQAREVLDELVERHAIHVAIPSVTCTDARCVQRPASVQRIVRGGPEV